MTLYLCMQGVLHKPLLYLSLYLKTHRAEYYRLLQAVREEGAWEAWLQFFLESVHATANQAFDAAMRITDLFRQDRSASPGVASVSARLCASMISFSAALS